MESENAVPVLPVPGELRQTGPPHYLTIRVIRLDLAPSPPAIEYEVLNNDGSRLSGPLRAVFDAAWSASFHRQTVRPT